MVADLRMASPAAVELVNPKHRNERKTHMALITSYHVPGLYVEDHSIDVPLDWRGLEPMLLAVGSTMRRGAMPAPIAGAPESIKLFYRVVCAPDRINDDLPLLLFLQGGPGGESPRPLSPTSDGWIEEAVKHFRVVLPDQRGTGRSSCVDGRTIKALGERATAAGSDAARSQADFLKRHLASSIVRDFEYLRLGHTRAELRRLFDVELSVALPRGHSGKLYLRRHPPRAGERKRGLRAHLPAHGRQDAAVLRPLPR